MNDQNCIEAILGGDKQAFRFLLERYEHKVYGFVYKILKDPQLSEDIAQETFLSVYRNLKQYDATKPFSTWLFAIAKNASFKLIKDRARSEIAPEEAFHQFTEEKDQVESQIIREEANQSLISALETLTDSQNQAITLRYFEELGLDEIARRMGLTRKKTENILYSAKQKLKSTLRQNQEDHSPYAKTV